MLVAVNAQMVAAQGGDLNAPRAIGPPHEITSDRAGVLSSLDVEALGRAVIELGGGRRRAGMPIDHAVGLEMLVRLGQRVDRGQPLLRVFAAREALERNRPQLVSSFKISDTAPVARPLILDRITS